MIHLNLQVIEIKEVNSIALHRGSKKGNLNSEGERAEVTENKYRKNVSFQSCADVIENKLFIVFLRIC